MTGASATLRGTVLTIVGIVCISPDAVLVRWAHRLEASILTIIILKQMMLAVILMSYLFYTEGWTLFSSQRYQGGGYGYFACLVVISGMLGAGFPTAFLFTYVASVYVLSCLQPIWAAIMGYIWLKDPLPRRTVAAIFGASLAVAIMFLPDMFGRKKGDFDTINLVGMGIALALGIATSAYIIVLRIASRNSPELPVNLASATGAFIGATLTLLASTASRTSVLRDISPLVFVATAIDGLCVTCFNIFYSIAPRYISGVQVSLVSLLVVILGPLWVFVVYDEYPPVCTLLGGVVILMTVGAHEYAALREEMSGDTAIGRFYPLKVALAPDVDVTNTRDQHARECDDDSSLSAPLLSKTTPTSFYRSV